MDVMTYSDARAQLKGVMDRAIHDKQEVVVTRKKGESVVVVSLDTWNASTWRGVPHPAMLSHCPCGPDMLPVLGA